MKLVKISIIIIAVLMLCSFVYSLTAPDESNTQTISTIQQEGQATRKYISDELSRQETAFFKQMDSRANYYENTIRDIETNAVTKLGLFWFGVVLFVTSFNNFLRNRVEKKRYKKLKDNTKEEIMLELMKVAGVQKPTQEIQKHMIRSDTGAGVVAETHEMFRQPIPEPPSPYPNMPNQTIKPPSRRQQKKLIKKLKKLNDTQNIMQRERAKVESELGIRNQASMQSQASNQGEPHHPQRQMYPPEPEIVYQNEFEVNY